MGLAPQNGIPAVLAIGAPFALLFLVAIAMLIRLDRFDPLIRARRHWANRQKEAAACSQ